MGRRCRVECSALREEFHEETRVMRHDLIGAIQAANDDTSVEMRELGLEGDNRGSTFQTSHGECLSATPIHEMS